MSESATLLILPLRVYLASSFDLVPRVQRLSEKLEERGFEITHKWWELGDHKDQKMNDKEWYKQPIIKELKQKALIGISKADIFILVCPKTYSKCFNGANVELGYAIAKGKRCWYYGEIERSAMYEGLELLVDINQLRLEG